MEKDTAVSATSEAPSPTFVDNSGNPTTPTGPCPCGQYSSGGTCLCDCPGGHTDWTINGNNYFECHQLKNCSAWFAQYPNYFIDAGRPHIETLDFSNCMATMCKDIGDGNCGMAFFQPETNTAQCHWDGGDCCLRTTITDWPGYFENLQPYMCQDPMGNHTDPWMDQGVRPNCDQRVYREWDYCVKDIIEPEHYMVPAFSPSRKLQSSHIPFTYNSNWTGSGDFYGFPVSMHSSARARLSSSFPSY